ncbi:hypothetical protein ZIOFF_018506 [Zingiber officinale]|uniref:BRX domain-containing protein n=1 Tax=Zingiber officinale TaxID=94328 RepID=A0A8J5H8A8_ZINOF|nr:hypothetical protein ZIOFF_018506 [Zingiber officinale]
MKNCQLAYTPRGTFACTTWQTRPHDKQACKPQRDLLATTSKPRCGLLANESQQQATLWLAGKHASHNVACCACKPSLHKKSCKITLIVTGYSQQSLPTPPRFEDEVKKGCALECSSSDSLEQHKSCRGHYNSHQHSHCYDSSILTTTPKLSSISGSKTETSSTDASTRASSSPKELDQSEEIFSSVNNGSDMEREWVEEDVPGVYITIRELPRGIRELCRVRFRSVFYQPLSFDSSSSTIVVVLTE